MGAVQLLQKFYNFYQEICLLKSINMLKTIVQKAVSAQISQNLLFRTSTRAFATDFGEEQTGEPEAERRTSHEKSLNTVQLLGRVGNDPRLISDRTVVFSLATTEHFTNAQGEKQSKTTWHDIVSFMPYQNEVLVNHVPKGSRILVQGKLSNREVTDRETGNVRRLTNIIANEIIRLQTPNHRK